MSTETKWIVAGVVAWIVVAVFVWAICASSKRADEMWDEARRREGMDR